MSRNHKHDPLLTLLTCGLLLPVPVPGTQAATPPLALPSGTPAAQSTPPPTPPAATPPPGSTTQTVEAITALKHELDLVRSFQSDLLTTVYWALGVAGGVGALLVGYNWISAWKMYSRDKRTLFTDLTRRSAAGLSNLDRTLRNEMVGDRERTETAITSLREEVRAGEQQLRNDITAAADRVREATSALVERTTEITRNSMDHNYNLIENHIHRVQFRSEMDAGRPSVAVTHAVAQLEFALRFKNPYFIQRALEDLLEAMESGGELSERELETTPSLLQQVPQEVTGLRDQVMARLRGLRPS